MKCKLCESEMKLRQAKQGKNAGNYFWGCSSYPNCKGIQDATEEDIEANKPKPEVVAIATHSGVMHNTSQSSYEFGQASNRHKVYYNDVKDLIVKIEALRLAGLVEDDLLVKPEDFLKENETN